ncbi:MAG: glycerophosphodiester phosphodiesterase family protein [Erythrobacter sp.]|jgi:glycerophosphoryl diester phosphodiesterase
MRSLLSRLDRVLAPAPDPARVGWLREWTYAHRGRHGAGRVENSPSAFRAAIEAGLGIECDIQRSRDDWPMVFHDWDFVRLLGRPEPGEQVVADEWRQMRYSSGDAPLALDELLAMIGGRVPLLIEVKSKPGYDVEWTCRRVIDMLDGYAGLHAIMSFDPRVSRWLRRNSPGTVRGLVMREDDKGHTQSELSRHLALWAARADFLAYHVQALPSAMVAAARSAGVPILTWTVNSPETRERARLHADAPIAEGAGLP